MSNEGNVQPIKLEILKTQLDLGLEKEVRLLHLTDTHISFAYDHEDKELVELANNRRKFFDKGIDGQCEKLFLEIKKYAMDNGMPIICTGDFIDFFSQANFDYLRHAFDGVEYMYAAGNHDFCHFVGKAKEDWLYKKENVKYIAPHINNNLLFSSRVFGGVNVVTLDDSYYSITKAQIEMLRFEIDRGYPILLFMHVPFYVPEYEKKVFHGEPCYMLDIPRHILSNYDYNRFYEMGISEETMESIDFIMKCPEIKAVFAGHTHFSGEEPLPNGVMQYITDGSYKGYAREIIIK